MFRSRLAAIGWGRLDSLPSPSSWIRGVALGVLLFVIVVWVRSMPSAPFMTGEDRLAHPSGNSIVEFFLRSPLHLALVLVPTAISIWIGMAERGREGRHDRLALVAVVLAALGLATGLAGLEPTYSYSGEWRPFGLLALSVGSLAACAVVSLISLAILLLTRSARRGRVFVLFTLVWSVSFGGFLYAFILVPRDAPAELQDGIQLPSVVHGQLRSYTDLAMRQARAPRDVLRIRADGEIECDGRSIDDARSPEGEAELRLLLTTIAAGMASERGRPDEVLFLRADRRAPASVPALILTLCREEGIELWRIVFEVELERVQEGLPNWGEILTYLPREEPDLDSDEDLEFMHDVIEMRAVEDDTADVGSAFHYGGEVLHDARELVATILAHDANAWKRPPILRVDPRLSWGAVAETLSELLDLDPSNGDRSLYVTGVEVLQ